MDSDSNLYYFGCMPIAKLLYHLSDLSPQARYALMKLWLESRHTFPLQLSVQDWAHRTAMPRSRAGKVINELIDAGHIEPDFNRGQRGRPKRSIGISAATIKVLRNLTPSQPGDALHLESVHRLLAHRTSDADADSPLLSPANLIFLIALLSHANECGAIHNLGTSRLMSYTGMTAQTINVQISKMKKLGVILCTVSGITGSQIIGRATTSYWLDLSHNLFKQPIPSTIIQKSLVTLDSGDAAHALFDLKSQTRVVSREYARKSGKQLSDQRVLELASAKLHIQQVTQIPNFDFSLVEDFFREEKKRELRLAFQTVVDRAARVIAFSRMAETPNEHKRWPTIGQLKALYRELLPARFQSPSTTEFPLKENRQMLLRLVLEIAFSIANDILANLPTSEFKFSRVASFELAPTPRGSNYRFLITAVYPPPDSHSTESRQSNTDTS